MPVEATENVAPIVFWRKELKPDSGGAGRTRGGVGQIMEIGAKGDLEFAVNATFDRVAHAPKGREGGLDGAAGAVQLKSGQTLRTKGFQIIPDGERLVLELPGGAGMGDPAARDPALVARDVRDGLVSAENARALYKRCGRCRRYGGSMPRHRRFARRQPDCSVTKCCHPTGFSG